LGSEKRRQREEIQKAITKAFNNTEKYYAYLDQGNAQNRDREFDLASDWDNASILIKDLDTDLANRLSLKAGFWRDGGTWSAEKIKSMGIQLARVRKEGMDLFNKRIRGQYTD
jgi:hypothetical protein